MRMCLRSPEDGRERDTAKRAMPREMEMGKVRLEASAER